MCHIPLRKFGHGKLVSSECLRFEYVEFFVLCAEGELAGGLGVSLGLKSSLEFSPFAR